MKTYCQLDEKVVSGAAGVEQPFDCLVFKALQQLTKDLFTERDPFFTLCNPCLCRDPYFGNHWPIVTETTEHAALHALLKAIYTLPFWRTVTLG